MTKKTDSLENVLVNLQTGSACLTTPNLPAVAALALPGDEGVHDRADYARFDGETEHELLDYKQRRTTKTSM